MKNKHIPLHAALILLGVVSLMSCSNRSESTQDYAPQPGSASRKEEADAAVVRQDVTRMEREASLRFRVKDVKKSTSVLEKMAVKHGGYVSVSNFEIEEEEVLIRSVSVDSAREVRKLNQSNHIEVFVLNTKLDSFLDQVGPLVDHLNYRRISAYDAAMESSHGENTAEKPAGGVKLKALRSQYARITLDIYQTPVVRQWIIPNPDSIEVARGGFWDDFRASLASGGKGILQFINGLVSLWPLWLILFTAWLLLRKKLRKIRGISAPFRPSAQVTP